MPETVDRLLDRLRPVSLGELDERAALLRWIDCKYVVEHAVFERLLETLASDHAVLDIDERRRFAYESVYFDTPDLRCFRDHVTGARPRFKTRIRRYVDTDACCSRSRSTTATVRPTSARSTTTQTSAA